MSPPAMPLPSPPSAPPVAVPAVVLVKPREQGNIGAAARAMANMGLDRLIVVEPAGEFGPTARAFAVGAHHLLEGALRVASLRDALAPFARVVGTTSTRDRSLGVPLLGPRDLPAFLAQDPPGTPTVLVFGPEVGGLTNEDLSQASAVVTIPCSPVQPTLNLSQAVLIVAYELYHARLAASGAEEGQGTEAAGTALEAMEAIEPPATAGEIEGLMAHAAVTLGAVGFDRDSSYEGVLRDLRRLIGRARPGARDIRILRGICRRVQGALAGQRGDG